MQTKETKEKLREIIQAKKEEKRSKIYRRLLAIEQRLYGKSCKDIALELSVCPDTIYDWITIYDQGGVSLLRKLHYEGRRVSKLESYKKQIKAYVKKESVRTLSEVQNWLKESHSVEVEYSWLFRFCKKNLIFHTRRPA